VLMERGERAHRPRRRVELRRLEPVVDEHDEAARDGAPRRGSRRGPRG
jgi:hypothetical protein